MTIRYFYLRDNHNRQARSNGTTTRGNPIAILISEVDRDTNTIAYAFSVSHPADSFEKDRGRIIVNARLRDPKKHYVIHGVPTGCHDITRAILNDILTKAYEEDICKKMKGPKTPQIIPYRVRVAAKLWLEDAAVVREAKTIPVPALQDGVEIVVPETSTVPDIRA